MSDPQLATLDLSAYEPGTDAWLYIVSASLTAMTEEELVSSIATDPDFKDVPEDWHKNAVMKFPKVK